MAIVLTDAEIEALLAERKSLPKDYCPRTSLKPKRGHMESQRDLQGVDGSEFRLIVRQAAGNPLDFSVILAYGLPRSNRIILLRRYNGKSHEHTNPLEDETFYDFHVHEATERYQDSAHKDETFAKPTDRYANVEEAIDCLIRECGFELPYDPQMKLFD
jgi:hypothetical protein